MLACLCQLPRQSLTPAQRPATPASHACTLRASACVAAHPQELPPSRQPLRYHHRRRQQNTLAHLTRCPPQTTTTG
jgi:hypothetical protein